jgi:2-C-methyl-D-erythritol 4-phosphate cytidylyltransferase
MSVAVIVLESDCPAPGETARPISATTVDTLVVVTLPRVGTDPIEAAAQPFRTSGDVVLVEPGPTRRQSMSRALAALPPQTEVVLIQTDDRVPAPPEVVTAIVAAVRAGAWAVVPVSPLADTVKRVGDSGELLSTVDRSALRVVQTPQGFAREALAGAVAGAAPGEDDDEITLFGRLGVPVRTISGDDVRATGRSRS